MKYKILGRTGIKTSILGLGTWLNCNNKVDFQSLLNIFDYAYQNGINFFDTAEIYALGKSEKALGAILKAAGWPRQNYLISTKVFWGGPAPTANGLNKKHLRDACDMSLHKLGLNYIDFFVCHRPDFNTPVLETIEGMNNLIAQGKILYWGTSEWPLELLQETCLISKQYGLIPPVFEQSKYNMFDREAVEVNSSYLYDKLQIDTIAAMPLAGGILTNKYSKIMNEHSRGSTKGQKMFREHLSSEIGKSQIDKAKQLFLIANDIGMSLSQMALAWLIKKDRVSSILLGASNINQLIENIRSIEDMELITTEAEQQIEDILANKPEQKSRIVPTYNEVILYE